MFAKAFRLFVSSTFQDFGEERRLLQEQVFPALVAYCAKEGFGFRAVDMRWGVNDDAQLNQRTAEICLGEVVEAKGYPAPNMLILIGDRYGWTPLPFAIARDEFEALRDWLLAQEQSDAVADLDQVYALDENHLVLGGLSARGADKMGAYTLCSREDDLIDLAAAEAWAPVEARLRDALQAAARGLHASGQLRDAELQKYTLSLTEQEIRKGLEQLAAGDGAAAANSIAWLRTTAAAEAPVQSLAQAVQRALPDGNALHAELPAGSDGYGEHFTQTITAKLIAAIDAQIVAFKGRAAAPDFALQTERAIHGAFAADRLRVFVGRASNLAAIAGYISSDVRHPLVLTGISGSGKTALMARAAAEAKGAVVQRFVGASAGSATQRNLLISMIEDLAALGVAPRPEQFEDDDNRFVNQVRDFLSGLDQPVAIFIDALDQLRAPYRPMWLPPQLHPKVKLIVSVLDDDAFAADRTIVQGLRRSLPEAAFLAIEPLSAQDGADMLSGLKSEAQRGLSHDQEAFILERFHAAGASPLYLRIAFAIARRWRSTDDPRARGLARDVTALIGQFLDELSSVHHHEPLLVRRALGLIAAAREGLSESEAIAVLSRDADVMASVSSARFGVDDDDRLPDSVWVRLKRSLSALLVEKGEAGEPLISFFHRQLAQVVRERFYEPEKAALHAALAKHFDPPAKNAEADPPWTRRGFIELPYQLFHAGMRERLDALLTDPAWIDLKVRSFAGAREIVEDYQHFANLSDRLQSLIGRTLGLCSGILRRDPKQVIVQLHRRLLGFSELEPFIARLFDRIPRGALYETCPALTPPGAEVARLEGHRDTVRAIAVLRDGRLASGAIDKTIRLWDPETGAEVARLEGHRGPVTALTILPDGRLASGSGDKTIRLWDPETGAEVARLDLEGGVGALAALPDGRLASVSGDTIRLWNLKTGTETASLELDGWVSAIAALPDGCLALGVSNKGIYYWDPAIGPEAVCRGDHSDRINAFAVFSDGRIASGGGGADQDEPADNSIVLWQPEFGTYPMCLDGHEDAVTDLAVLPDGRLASASNDKTIRLWDPRTGTETAKLDLDGVVGPLAVLPDGRLASGSWDNTIRLWNLEIGAEASIHPDRNEPITALAVLADGRLAITSGDYAIRLLNPSTGAETTRFRLDGMVKALAVLPDGRLAAGTWDDHVRLMDPTTGAETARFLGQCDDFETLAALPNGRLASGSGQFGYNSDISLWDPEARTETTKLTGHGGMVCALAVVRDGRLVSSSYDNTIRLWDIENSTETARFNFPARMVALAVLPDGRLVSGSSDKALRFWDLASGQEISGLELDANVWALAVLADGRLVASDQFGRLHWLAIKGMEGRGPGGPSVSAGSRAPIKTARSIEPRPARSRNSAPKSKRRVALWAFAIFFSLFTAAALSAPALNDLWQGIRAASAGP